MSRGSCPSSCSTTSGLPLKLEFDRGEEQDDQLNVAQSDDIYVKNGVIGASEIREMRFGLPEPAGQTIPRYIFTGRAGPDPLVGVAGCGGAAGHGNGRAGAGCAAAA